MRSLRRRFWDITRPISPSTPVYEGDPEVRIEPCSRLEPNDPGSWNAHVLHLGTHTATHVDAPWHMCPDGTTVDQLPLHWLIGPAEVLDLRPHEVIDASVLSAHPSAATATRLLLRTGGSDIWEHGFRKEYPHLTKDAACWLREHSSVRLVGIDTWSVESYDSHDFAVHRCLLCQRPPIVIVEGLDLSRVPPGHYHLTVLPLLAVGTDGAPARAVLASSGASG